MTYYAEFTTVLLILLACVKIGQALLVRCLGMAALHFFAAGFYGTVALIGVSILNRGA